MPTNLSKEEIIKELENNSSQFALFCAGINDDIFFRQPLEKWSVAQNVTHLITSANMTRLAYRLPKFMVRIYSGNPTGRPAVMTK